MFRNSLKLSNLVVLVLYTIPIHGNNVISLALNGRANYAITSPSNASACEKYAAQELKRFLDGMSTADFEISEKILPESIVVSAISSLPKSYKSLTDATWSSESYAILKQEQTIFLIGGSPGETLFAVYDFLNQLGCRWIAPDFNFYERANQHIPSQSELNYVYKADLTRHPTFKYRKLYIEEGLSHNTENLLQLIEWMPKARYNILVAPINYEGKGRVQWNNWRERLIPELKLRGITIEVGGHGYQNFLNSNMLDGQLFKDHPEWFGMDSNGNRSPDPHIVFCTSNKDAMNYLLGNIFSYLKSHPEIIIFDFWPPDSEKWCECEKCKDLGLDTDRHAMLVSQTAKALKKEYPKVKLECIAYSRYVEPPQNEILDKNVLLDFCPINQSFEYQIYQDSSINNRYYKENLIKWLDVFKGEISIYSYYRKYAWRSLPNIIPHYMQNDLRFYRDIGAKGISVYSEPGDWFTYGLNHFVLSNLAWNPEANVDSLITDYSSVLFGPAANVANYIYSNLEEIVRQGCGLPFTKQKKTEQYQQFLRELNVCCNKVKATINMHSPDLILCNHLNRLLLMLNYASKNISMMDIKTNSVNDDIMNRIQSDIKKMMLDNANSGVFIVR